MSKLIYTLILILSGLTLGYILQVLNRRGTIRLPLPVPVLRIWLQKIGMLFFLAISFGGAIWIIKIDDLRIVILPFLGIFSLILGGGLALCAARLINLERKQVGAYFACGSFSNISSIGTLVVLWFWGENGFAFVPLYKLFEEISYYTIGFPITKYYATEVKEGGTFYSRLKEVFKDIFVLTTTTAIALGAILNLTGINRPELFGTICSFFVPAGTFTLLVSIGLAMHFSRTKDYFKESFVIAAIKFILIPFITGTVAYLLGFGEIDQGLPLKVVIILSSMPVAFTALIPPSIYDLDIDLANACWLTTTLALVVVLPWLYFFTAIF